MSGGERVVAWLNEFLTSVLEISSKLALPQLILVP